MYSGVCWIRLSEEEERISSGGVDIRRIADIPKLYEIKMGREGAFGTDSLASLEYYKNDFPSSKILTGGGLKTKTI